MLVKLFQNWTGLNQFLVNHAWHAVVQSAAVADGGGAGGAVAIDNYEKPVSSVDISGRN